MPNPAKALPSKDLEAAVIASQLAPMIDRFGRLLIDLAPHFAMLGGTIQTALGNNPNVSHMTNYSTITNESGQRTIYT
jgi:hypothetical protein